MHPEALVEAIKFREKYLDPAARLRIVELGARDVNGTLRELFDRPPLWTYLGADLDPGPNVDVVLADPYVWPELIEAKRFDVVLASSVLEHVGRPWQWMRSIASILKYGGYCYILTHNTWEFHEHPRDCWRVWPDGMRELFDYAGFVTLASYVTGPDTIAIAKQPSQSQLMVAEAPAALL